MIGDIGRNYESLGSLSDEWCSASFGLNLVLLLSNPTPSLERLLNLSSEHKHTQTDRQWVSYTTLLAAGQLSDDAMAETAAREGGKRKYGLDWVWRKWSGHESLAPAARRISELRFFQEKTGWSRGLSTIMQPPVFLPLLFLLIRGDNLIFFSSLFTGRFLKEAGESFFFFEVQRMPEHSEDETLVISISTDVFRGRERRRRKRRRGGKEDSTKNPRDSAGCIKKKPRAQNNTGVGVTASFLEFLPLMSLLPWRQWADS